MHNDWYCENRAVVFNSNPDDDPFILTPSNTWSNFAFITVGSISIALSLRDYLLRDDIKRLKHTSQVRKHPEWLMLHGCLLIYGGLGSFAYHASFVAIG
mmetsp:Transcript_6874/g.11083  ORF Transcript_6874/g.11083 Transcript_6874/m.11083 type:complete len:99 (-) Transcript_6874:801-1097(-)